MDRFTQAYIECALWSSSEGDQGEIRLNEYDGDIAPKTLTQMQKDCEEFQRDNAELLASWYEFGETEERAGHDFWLTRCGHGAGFWDRFSSDEIGYHTGKQLSDKARACGNRDLYIGDDGLIYQA